MIRHLRNIHRFRGVNADCGHFIHSARGEGKAVEAVFCYYNIVGHFSNSTTVENRIWSETLPRDHPAEAENRPGIRLTIAGLLSAKRP